MTSGLPSTTDLDEMRERVRLVPTNGHPPEGSQAAGRRIPAFAEP